MVVNTDVFKTGLVTVREAAQILNVHTNTLRRWCDLGVVQSYRINTRGDRRIPKGHINALVEHMHQNHGLVRSLQCCLLIAWFLQSLRA